MRLHGITPNVPLPARHVQQSSQRLTGRDGSPIPDPELREQPDSLMPPAS
jgi:hypothetical protein